MEQYRFEAQLASNTNWLIDLAAIALVQGHTTGIFSLLPLNEAGKLLVHNKLEPFRRQTLQPSEVDASSNVDLRTLAQKAFPTITFYYSDRVIHGKNQINVNRKGFVAWIVKELSKPESGLNLHLLKSSDFKALAEARRSERWWLDQLRMQSK